MSTPTLLGTILGPSSLGRGKPACCFATWINRCFCLSSEVPISAKINSQEGTKPFFNNEQQWRQRLPAPKMHKISNRSGLSSEKDMDTTISKAWGTLWKTGWRSWKCHSLQSGCLSGVQCHHQLTVAVDTYMWIGPIYNQSCPTLCLWTTGC